MQNRSNTNGKPPANIKALLISGVISNFFNVAIVAGILFLTAGRTDWPFAWIYILGYLIFRLASLYVSVRHIQHSDSKRPSLTDRLLDMGYGLTHPLTMLLAGFEFSLRQNPYALGTTIQGIALVFLLLTFVLMIWSQWENPFYYSSITGENVVKTGPYQFIRHPGYAGLFILALVRPLLLGSQLGLYMGIVGASIMILRTVREDAILKKDSEQYRQYAQTVRYRIFSGIW